MRFTRQKALVVVLVAVFLAAMRETVFVLDIGKRASDMKASRSYNGGNCKRISGFETDGFEDIVYLNDTAAVSCAGDLIHLFSNASYRLPQESRGSRCVLLSMLHHGQSAMRTIPLRFASASGVQFRTPGWMWDGIEPPPMEDTRLLHLHGLDIVPATDGMPAMVFGINHGFGTVGETVEVFHLYPDNATMVHVRTLAYDASWRSQLLGITNDMSVSELHVHHPQGVNQVGAVSGTFFVSKYLEVADDALGRAEGAAWRGIANRALLYLRVAIGWYNTMVLRCSFAEDAAQPVSCAPAITGMLMANGLAVVRLPLSKKSNTFASILVAVDLLSHRLVLHTTEGPFPVDSYAVPYVVLRHAVDNIVVNAADPPRCKRTQGTDTARCSFSLFCGAVPSVWSASHLETLQEGHLDLRSPGGTTLVMMEVVIQISTRTLLSARSVEQSVVMMHDGEFHGTSSGLVLSGTPHTIIMGSYKLKDLLVCRQVDQIRQF